MDTSLVKRFKRWSPRGRRLAYARQRAQVERLEDRLLLSAEPMLQQTRPDTTHDLSADNVQLTTVERKTVEIDLSRLEAAATRIDLTQGTSQNIRLAGAGDLMSLSGETANLIVDLSEGNSKVTLSTEPDGRLRVSSDSLYDLVFAKPTGVFAIRGQGGTDQVVIKTADLGTSMLVVEAETIEVSEGAVLQAYSGVHLIAESLVSAEPTSSLSKSSTTSISINGSVKTAGDLLAYAHSVIDLNAKPALTLASLDLSADARASAVLGPKASVNAAGVFVVADTDVRIEVDRIGVERSAITLSATQKSEAGARGNATVKVVNSNQPVAVDVVFEATDSTQIRSVIGARDTVLADSASGKEVWNRIIVNRDALAYLGDGTGKVVVGSVEGAPAPTVHVGAVGRDRPTGGILSDFAASKQVGSSTIQIQSTIEAALHGAELNVEGLRAFALDATTVAAQARQARNLGDTSTGVRLDSTSVSASGEVNLIAQDRSIWTAIGGGYTGDVLEAWSGVTNLPASLAGNDVEASVSVKVARSALASGTVRSYALASQRLAAEVKSGSIGPLVPGVSGLLLGFDLNIGSIRAWNTLNGGVGVLFESGSIASTGSIDLAARDGARLNADVPTGFSTAPDGDQGPAIAINLVGRYVGDLGVIDMTRLAGGEPTDTGKPRDVAVTINGGALRAVGSLGVDARSSLVMSAIADALSETTVRVAAAAVVAINRYRGSTRADVESRSDIASLKAGGTVSVVARELMTVDALASTGGTGSSMEVGGILVLNDLNRDLSARLDGLGVDAGALVFEAIDSATIRAHAEGKVDASASDAFSDWTGLAANGSVVANWLVGGARVAANDVNLRVDDDASIRADSIATLSATNKVLTSGSAIAGAALAYNLIGREGAGSLKAGGVRAFLDGNAGTLATYTVGASFDKGFVDAGGDFLVSGNLALKATATLSQQSDAFLGSASAALVQNLSEASTQVRFAPTAGSEHYIGGHARISSADESELIATGTMSSGSVLASAGLAAVRNQANHVVDTRVTGARLTAGGDLDIWADSKPTIHAMLSGAVDAGGIAAGGTGIGGLSLNALMATNVINGGVSAIVSGGRLAAAGDLDLHAANDADIRAINQATTEGRAAASLALAFNAIGWQDQKMSELAIDAVLGKGMGSETPLYSRATVQDADLAIAGDASINASTLGGVDARLGSSTLGGSFGGAGFALSMNRVSTGSQAWIGTGTAPGAVAGRSKVLDVAVGGDLELGSSDETEINASVSLSSSGGKAAVGGTAVRNDARSRTIASIDDAKVATGGLLAVTADESATITSAADGTAKTDQSGTPMASSGFALNGLIVSNLMLAESAATVSDSDLVVAGDLVVDAVNSSTVAADNTAALRSSGTAAGVLLAFNTVGWNAVDLISQTVDTIVGQVGSEQPITVIARVSDSTLKIGGDAEINADVTADISSMISNKVSSRAGAASASLVLSANQVSSTASAMLADAGKQVGARGGAEVEGHLTIDSSDSPTVFADTVMIAASGEGSQEDPDELNADFVSSDGSQTIDFGSKVRVVDGYRNGGDGGRVYRFMGNGPIELDLSKEDYGDPGFWFEVVPRNSLPGVLKVLTDLSQNKTQLLKLPESSAGAGAWMPALTPTAAGSNGAIETQSITITPSAAGAVGRFSLALDEIETAPIALLPIGSPVAEVQRLTLINPLGAVGSRVRLSLAGMADVEFQVMGTAAQTATEIQSALADWFGADGVAASALPDRAAGWAFDIVLAGGQVGRAIDSITARVAAQLGAERLGVNVATIRDGQAAPTRADQAVLIQSALRAALAEPALTVTPGTDSALTFQVMFGRKGDRPQLRALDVSPNFTVKAATRTAGLFESGSQFTVGFDKATSTSGDTSNTISRFDLAFDFAGSRYTAEGINRDATEEQMIQAVQQATDSAGRRFDGVGGSVDVDLVTMKDGKQAWLIKFGGSLAQTASNLALRASDPSLKGSIADLTGDFSASGGFSLGGLVVRNDVRGDAQSLLLRTDLVAGSLHIEATDKAVIDAIVDSVVEATGGLGGGGLAANGVIATNMVLAASVADIRSSQVVTNRGDAKVKASEAASIRAVNSSLTSSQGPSIGLTMAFNTVGWQAQNLFRLAADAIANTQLGTAQPVRSYANITESTVKAAGSLILDAETDAFIEAELKNEVGSAAGLLSSLMKSGMPKVSVGLALASNMVNAEAKAGTTGTGVILEAGGTITIDSRNQSGIESTASLQPLANATVGGGLIDMALGSKYDTDFTDRSGRREVGVGDLVLVGPADYKSTERPALLSAGERVELLQSIGGGLAGSTYEYLGATPLKTVDFTRQDFSDKTNWRALSGEAGKTYMRTSAAGWFDLGSQDYTGDGWTRFSAKDVSSFGLAVAGDAFDALVGKGGGRSIGFGGLVVRNDSRSAVDASLDQVAAKGVGGIEIKANDNSRVNAEDESSVEAGGVGLNLVVATNTVLGGARAWANGGSLETGAGGDVVIAAVNDSNIDALIESSVAAAVSIGVTMAVNTIGFQPVNVLKNVADLIAGSSYAGQQPLVTQAWADGTLIKSGRNVTVTSANTSQIEAMIENSAQAVSPEFSKDDAPR